MKRRSFLFINIALIVLFCPLLAKTEPSGNLDTKHHDELAAMDIGYNVLHAYRKTLRNGWCGITNGTGREPTPECSSDIWKLVKNPGLLLQCT